MRDSELFGHVTAMAPGKVNLSLRVGPPRFDGYHDVATVYFAVSLYEEVTASPRNDGAITVTISERSAFTTVDQQDPETGEVVVSEIPTDERNLAYRAAELLREAMRSRQGSALSTPRQRGVDSRDGVDLTIIKNVPIAGGMGGGSADAAAALLACSALWDAGFSKEQLAELGGQLGADVPFALLGGAAVGQGIGDELSPLLSRGELHLVLVPAAAGLSTPQVYRKLDQMREEADIAPDAPHLDQDLLRGVASADPQLIAALMTNDMQAAAVSMIPELDAMMDAGLAAGALQGMVSGSGPTVLFLASDAEAAARISAHIEETTDAWAIPVSGPAAGARLLKT